MALARRDDRRYTYADYCAWPPTERYELIDGIAYAMAPAPSIPHQDMVLAIARQVADALEEAPAAGPSSRQWTYVWTRLTIAPRPSCSPIS